MEKVYFVISIASYVIAGSAFLSAMVMFFVFKIPKIIKDSSGSLEQQQIEEIRLKNFKESRNRSKVNVFEDLEKRAKLSNKTSGISLKTKTGEELNQPISLNHTSDPDTTVLQGSVKAVNPDFIIEKNIIFVSTSEVI